MTDWTRAACLEMDVELFDPGRPQWETIAEHDTRVGAALALCNEHCPIRDACLAANLTDTWLIVGGTLPEQRARLRRNANRAQRSPKSRGHKTTCPKGHDTTDPAARYPNGACKACTNRRKDAA